jgi:predicted phage terminase large subunit-like protein
MPPGHAKSTYASVLFPAWYLSRTPAASVIACSHTQQLAERFGRQVRNIVAGPACGSAFGCALAPDSQSAGRWATLAGGDYLAVGTGGSITGHRADLALIDDPIKGREQADSKLLRDKVWEWYRADLRTRLKPGAGIVLIQTRWHEDDLAGRILGGAIDPSSGAVRAVDGEAWHVLSLPALAEEDDPLGRAPGEALWPDMFDAGLLKREREIQGPRNWSALYQQRPVPDSGDYFKRDWLRWFEPDRTDARTLALYGASDYAVTAGGGDYTVHGVIGVDAEDNIYVLDWWRGRTDSLTWVDALCDLIERWGPREWGEEKGQIARSLGPFIDKRQRERGAYCARVGLAPVGDKAARAQAIRGRMAQGKVLLPKGVDWAGRLVDELLLFPAGAFDDQVDVLGLFGRMLSRMGRGTAPIPRAAPAMDARLTFDQLRERIAGRRRDLMD